MKKEVLSHDTNHPKEIGLNFFGQCGDPVFTSSNNSLSKKEKKKKKEKKRNL